METAYIATGEILVYIACLLAAIGAFLPVLPGPLLSFAAILVFKLVFPESGVGWLNIWICGFLAAFAQLADIFMSWLGAKKFGATWRGGLGAFIGVFVGIFLPPPIFWIFVAPLAGAFLSVRMSMPLLVMDTLLMTGWGWVPNFPEMIPLSTGQGSLPLLLSKLEDRFCSSGVKA